MTTPYDHLSVEQLQLQIKRIGQAQMTAARHVDHPSVDNAQVNLMAAQLPALEAALEVKLALQTQNIE